jgi:hypothetical protein
MAFGMDTEILTYSHLEEKDKKGLYSGINEISRTG